MMQSISTFAALLLVSGMTVFDLRAQEPEVLPPASRVENRAPRTHAARDAAKRAAVPGLQERLDTVRAKRPETKAAPQRDALDTLLDRLGGEDAWYALSEFTVERELTAIDTSGQVLFEHRFVHRSRAGHGPARDTLEWSKQLHFGIQGARAWARSGGIDRPDLESRARDEITRWSTLLHLPFSLRDRKKYRVENEQNVKLLGRTLRRIRVVVATSETGVGPMTRDKARARESWGIFVDPNSGLPIVVEHRLPGIGARRVLLGKWQRVGAEGLQLPLERTILSEDGESPRLLVRLRIR